MCFSRGNYEEGEEEEEEKEKKRSFIRTQVLNKQTWTFITAETIQAAIKELSPIIDIDSWRSNGTC